MGRSDEARVEYLRMQTSFQEQMFPWRYYVAETSGILSVARDKRVVERSGEGDGEEVGDDVLREK